MDTEKLVIGKTIKIPAMRKGLVQYPNEVILVNQACLEQLAKTSHGIPVVIEHPGVKLDPESIKDVPIHGRVADMHYDQDKDEWSVHFVVDTEEAVTKLKSGWGVSTAWFGDKYGSAGTYNAVPYDRELLEGHYEHLAIVKDPRYEMAQGPVFYNSKNDLANETKKDTINTNLQKSGGKEMLFKLFRTIREEIKTNENEQYMLNIAGQDVPLSNVLEEMKNMEAKKNEEEKKKEETKAKTLNGEDMVEHNGEKMSVNALVEKYNAMKKENEVKPEEKKEEKENAETPEEKAKKEAEAKKNADDAEAKKKEDEAKKNAEDAEKAKVNSRFVEVKNLNETASPELDLGSFVTLRERTEAGRKAYGSKT
jgi:outer membrane biosynthesis protein TonB